MRPSGRQKLDWLSSRSSVDWTDCPPRRLINPEEILWLLAAQAPKVDFSK